MTQLTTTLASYDASRILTFGVSVMDRDEEGVIDHIVHDLYSGLPEGRSYVYLMTTEFSGIAKVAIADHLDAVAARCLAAALTKELTGATKAVSLNECVPAAKSLFKAVCPVPSPRAEGFTMGDGTFRESIRAAYREYVASGKLPD